MEFYSHVFKCTSLPSLWLMAFYLLPATAPQGVLYPFALHISICECFESLHGWIHTFWRSGQVKCSQKPCNQVFIRDLRQEGVYVAVFWIVLQLLLSATIFCLDGNISGTLDVHFFSFMTFKSRPNKQSEPNAEFHKCMSIYYKISPFSYFMKSVVHPAGWATRWETLFTEDLTNPKLFSSFIGCCGTCRLTFSNALYW